MLALPLSKNIPNFVDKFLVFEVRGLDLFQLFQELPLLAREHRRRDDRDRHKKIAATAAAQHRHSLPAHAKDRTGLRSGRDLERLLTAERLNANLRSQRRLCERDRNGSIQIISLPLELLVLGHMDDDV